MILNVHYTDGGGLDSTSSSISIHNKEQIDMFAFIWSILVIRGADYDNPPIGAMGGGLSNYLASQLRIV